MASIVNYKANGRYNLSRHLYNAFNVRELQLLSYRFALYFNFCRIERKPQTIITSLLFADNLMFC